MNKNDEEEDGVLLHEYNSILNEIKRFPSSGTLLIEHISEEKRHPLTLFVREIYRNN